VVPTISANRFTCTFIMRYSRTFLRDLAKTTAALPQQDMMHSEALRDSAKALYLALKERPAEMKKSVIGSG
jgi:hypothetical protein